MTRTLCHIVLLGAAVVFGTSVSAQVLSPPDPNEPDHIRGQIVELSNSSMTVKTVDGESLQLGIPDWMSRAM